MSSPPSQRWLQVEQLGDVTVVRFTPSGSLFGDAVHSVSARLFELVEDQGRTRLVLNLALVEGMESAMVGKLVALNRRVLAAGGRLKICCVQPQLAEVLATLKIPELIHLYADEQGALRTF